MKGAGYGAAAGTVLGLAGGLIAGSVGAKAKERKALKAKAKAGTLTESEKARYEELKADRRKMIAKSTGAGLLGGAVVGGASGYYKEKSGIEKDIKNNSGVFITSDEIEKGPDKAAQHALKDNIKARRADRKDRNGEGATFGKDGKHFSDADYSAKDRLENTFSALDLIGAKKSEVKIKDKEFSAKEEGAKAPKSFVLDILKK